MANIYALLVGINNYPSLPLRGCINDVRAVKEYLTKFVTNNSTLSIKTLTDEDAEKPTRQGLINAFDFFNPAKDEDICLFYYSGHGSYATAPKEFQSYEKTLQSFVCSDSRLPGGKDLMDKEMGYLIWKTMQDKPNVTFIAITDCCHSGTITKDIDLNYIQDRMYRSEDGKSPSKVEGYLGYDVTLNGQRAYEESFLNNSRVIKVRQGNHIHIAASRDNETSKELDIDGEVRGAFTHSLLKTLAISNGYINYKELVEKAAVLVKNMVDYQQPSININGSLKSNEQLKLFLSNSSTELSSEYLVYYDRKYASWCINGGSAYGIYKDDKVTIENICESQVTSSPAPHFSIIKNNPLLNVNNTYRATIQRLGDPSFFTVSFAIDFPKNIKASIISENSIADFPLTVLDKNAGRYVIRINSANECFISFVGSEAPIIKPLELKDKATVSDFIRQISLVGKWMQLLEFDNSAPTLTTKHYTIELKKSTKPNDYNLVTFEKVTDIAPVNDLYYKYLNGDWYIPAFYLTITNHTANSLLVTSAYLGFDFSIETGVFDIMEIAPGQTSNLKLKDIVFEDIIKMKLDKKFADLGYTEITEYIKLFIATDEIPVVNLQQEGVDMPAALIPKVITKGVFTEVNEKSAGAGDKSTNVLWKTETIGFKIIRPQAEMQITPGKDTAIGNLIIKKHSALSAKISLTSSAHTSKSADYILPPHLANKNSHLAPLDLMGNTRNATIMDVVKLTDINDKTVVSEEAPLTLQLEFTQSDDVQEIIPIGYDPETKLYYPLGYSNGSGEIIIEQLPDETPTDAEHTNKSFLGSIKIYLQKVIGQKLGMVYTYPRLAKVKVEDDLTVIYNIDEQDVKEAVAKSTSIVLFIHGIIGDTESIVKCIKTPLDESGSTIEKSTDLILTFDYENINTSISNTAADLRKKLEMLELDKKHGKKLTIVAHSLGGLVSRYFIEKCGGDEFVSKLIMLGTPNNGSPWANVRDMAQTFLTFAINGGAFLQPWVLTLSGVKKLITNTTTLKQMHPVTGIYTSLNMGIDPKIPYIIIAGNTQKIIAQYDQTTSLIKRMLFNAKKNIVYNLLDEVLFHKANDIAVTKDSIITLAGSEKWSHPLTSTEVASDHLTYFTRIECLKLIADNLEKKSEMKKADAF